MQSSSAEGLVMCGEGDDAWPVSAQRDMADRLDADFAVILGARHSPNTENPDELLEILIPTWRTWLYA
jgi:pimeloyl-ACP methyl ester carboxylesterase